LHIKKSVMNYRSLRKFVTARVSRIFFARQ